MKDVDALLRCLLQDTYQSVVVEDSIEVTDLLQRIVDYAEVKCEQSSVNFVGLTGTILSQYIKI